MKKSKKLRKKINRQYIGIYSVMTLICFLLLFSLTAIMGAYRINEKVYDEIKNDIKMSDYSVSNYRYNGEESHTKDNIVDFNIEIMPEELASVLYYNYGEISQAMLKDFWKTGTVLYTIPWTDGNIGVLDFELSNYIYDVRYQYEHLLIFPIAFLLVYLFGIFCFLIFGNIYVKKSLKPIRNITSLAENINENSLNLRLDIDSAKYELKDLCITLNNMLDRMQDVYKRQKTFVSDVSHELRTPISIIDGYANMLRRWGQEDGAIATESIEAICDETKSMKQLVEALLFLSKVDNHKIEFKKEEIDLQAMLEDIKKETYIIDKEDHEIEFVIEENLEMIGDYNKIKEALRIFIDNALKYTSKSKKIKVSSQLEEGMIVLSIEDEGIGIDQKYLGNIFTRFYRVDYSRNKQTGGSGLGLAIAKEIVLGHQGKISVESKVGEGTTIKMIFDY